jgi:hypothetical protein
MGQSFPIKAFDCFTRIFPAQFCTRWKGAGCQRREYKVMYTLISCQFKEQYPPT